MKTILLILCLISANALAATTDDESALMQAGTKLLNKEITPDQFVTLAHQSETVRPFTGEDREYLQDLRKKLSPDMEKYICSPASGLDCDGTQTAEKVPLEKLMKPEPADVSKVPDMPEPPSEANWNKPYFWIGAAVLAVVAGSFLKNKEIQMNYR